MKLTRLAIAGTGPLLATYVLARPWAGGNSPAAWADPRWPLSHLAAVAGFTTFAAAAWCEGHARGGRWGALLQGTGIAALPLLLPYYGAEAFALHAIAQNADVPAATQDALATSIRLGPIQMTTFGLGWLALAIAGLGFAAGRRDDTPVARTAAWVLGAGLAAYLPVFYAPTAVRIAHGVIIGIAALAWAAATSPALARRAGGSLQPARG